LQLSKTVIAANNKAEYENRNLTAKTAPTFKKAETPAAKQLKKFAGRISLPRQMIFSFSRNPIQPLNRVSGTIYKKIGSEKIFLFGAQKKSG
jgi:hypothetical protein